MLEVFKVKVKREDVTHLYYSEGVDATTKNCVVKLLDNTEIICEVIPTLYCRNKDSWKCVGHLAYDMTDSNGKHGNTARINVMRVAANRKFPG